MSIKKISKKIVFFDGDGTIWYPQKTKRTKPPYWIYGNTNSKNTNSSYLKYLSLSKTSLLTLKKLRKLGVYLVLLSTHPHPPKVARMVLKMKLGHLKIKNVFDEFHPTSGSPRSKGSKMIEILKKKKLSKLEALMVGDSYKYDYLPAKSVGIEVLILKSAYLKREKHIKKFGKLINEIGDVLKFIQPRLTNTNKRIHHHEK